MIEAGKTYYGPREQRLTVLEINGDDVMVMLPISCRHEKRTLAEMEEFVAGSKRRNYVHKNGERRTKVEQTKTHVVYQDAKVMKRVTLAEWKKWRAGA